MPLPWGLLQPVQLQKGRLLQAINGIMKRKPADVGVQKMINVLVKHGIYKLNAAIGFPGVKAPAVKLAP
jgi:hypothetical protein